MERGFKVILINIYYIPGFHTSIILYIEIIISIKFKQIYGQQVLEIYIILRGSFCS